MLLHIADDDKFIDAMIEQFETVASGENIYLINIPNYEYQVKYIKKIDKVILMPHYSKEYRNILNNKYDAILFHNLTRYKLKIIHNLPESQYIHWFSWGFDLYFIPYLKRTLLLPETKKLANKNRLINLKQKLSIYYPKCWNLINILSFRNSSNYYLFKKEIYKINSVSTVIDSEYELIQKYLHCKSKYIPFKYVSIEFLFNSISMDTYCNNNEILLGNSATLENNHLDAFEVIKSFYSKNTNIYVPLSYGNKAYANIVSKKGEEIFGDKFHPLFDFMLLKDYILLLQRCGIVVMNHIRQQAMGNIIISLYLGAKVFLQPTNPLYIFLIEKGVRLYDLKSLNNIDTISYKDLALYNRPIINSIYGKDNVLFLTKNLINNLIN